jgi:hypothetical protein
MGAQRSEHAGSAEEPSRFDPKNRIRNLDFLDIEADTPGSEISAALLRLLTRLAGCGLTPGGPPVLYDRKESI